MHLMLLVSNPCLSNECSQMCLISPVSGFRCACSYGFLLGKDGKTCKSTYMAFGLFCQTKILFDPKFQFDFNKANDMFRMYLNKLM